MLMYDRARSLLGLFSLTRFLGLGTSSPSQLEIRYEAGSKRIFNGKIKVPFNPSSIKTSCSVSWNTISYGATVNQQAYAIQYTGAIASPATVSFDLSLDSHEGEPRSGGGVDWGGMISLPNPTAMHILTQPSGVSILPKIAEIGALQTIDSDLHRPPLCQVWWGQVRIVEGPLTGLTQTFTRFMADGTPVRANLSLTFTDASMTSTGELCSADVEKSYTVRLGDTLQAIAARQYGDATLWRVIAEANAIDDPRLLTPGKILTIPALR